MNTNQDTTLTNQDEFENILHNFADEVRDNVISNFEDDLGAMINRTINSLTKAATKASEQRIQELKDQLNEITKAYDNLTLNIQAQEQLGCELIASNNQLREALQSAIECTDDYDMIDRMDGNQYFKHEIFKSEIALLEALKVTP